MKRDHLASLGVRYVSDSRSDQFVKDIRAWTGGAGVDVVLNSLSGELTSQSLICFVRKVASLSWASATLTKMRHSVCVRFAQPDVFAFGLAGSLCKSAQPDATGATGSACACAVRRIPAATHGGVQHVECRPCAAQDGPG